MGCNQCLNQLREQEIISKFNEGERQNDNNDNILYKETILTSNDEEDQENQESHNSNQENQEIQAKINSCPQELIKEKNEEFNMKILNEINKYRVRHGVEELVYDKKISRIAQKYAEKCARENQLELSDNKYNNAELGEIIFCGNEDLTPKDIVDIWYHEGSENYNYKKEPEISNNFTQLIWKNTVSFGLGHALTKENKLYIVANFYPEGNIKGEFLKNVFPSDIRSETVSVYSINTRFLEEILNSHNDLRAKHNSPPLILNPNLSTLAQNKVEKMAQKKEKKIKEKNKKFGANFYFSKNNCSGEEVSLAWYKGKNKYNFTKGVNNRTDEEVNNFTQLIWKSTKEVGFGFTNDEEGNFYVLALYSPKGNIKDEYKNNIESD